MGPNLIATIAWSMYTVFIIINFLDTRRQTKEQINFKIAALVLYAAVSAGYGALILHNLSK